MSPVPERPDRAGGAAPGPPFSGGLRQVHHVGMTVADMDRSIDFWRGLLGVPAGQRMVLDGPQVARLVDYEGVRIERCWMALPGGIELELLHYLDRTEEPYDAGTAHPGNVHVCIAVDDMAVAHRHAVACGACPVGDGPIDIRAGPNAGGRVAYLRNPDGVTLELVELPRPQSGLGRG